MPDDVRLWLAWLETQEGREASTDRAWLDGYDAHATAVRELLLEHGTARHLGEVLRVTEVALTFFGLEGAPPWMIGGLAFLRHALAAYERAAGEACHPADA